MGETQMNERIRDLANEAAKYSATMFLPTGENGDDLFVKKFAQLIVQQCANIAKETRWAVPPSQEQIARSIIQHFGVEE